MARLIHALPGSFPHTFTRTPGSVKFRRRARAGTLRSEVTGSPAVAENLAWTYSLTHLAAIYCLAAFRPGWALAADCPIAI